MRNGEYLIPFMLFLLFVMGFMIWCYVHGINPG